jgi:two-component system, sensor histidine kinase and response regulator
VSALLNPAPSSAKTNLSSQLLHDLRSPLNQIIGYSEMLGEEAEIQTNEDHLRDLETIRTAGNRLLALLEENFAAGQEETIPAIVSEEREAARQSVNAPPAEVAPGVVLIVDDDETNRDVLSRRLRRQGHTAVAAASGSDALRILRAREFDLVLLDIMMPDMDGYEVLSQLKADPHLRHVPVVMISAVNEVRSVVRCIEAGAEDYLAKPFNATLLRARIGACLEKKRGRDRETALFEQLRKNYQKLQEVEKLRDDMRSMIVHDLRTPLTAVIVSVEMLDQVGALNATQQDMMALAAAGGKTLLGMINDLLDVEKMESGSMQLRYEPLSAPDLVAAAVKQVTALARQSETTLVTEMEPSLPPFSGDENKLGRTLVNLIANAIKFTRAGTVTILVSSSAGNMRFEVRDTGDGIPATAFNRIFEKFGQLDARTRVGTGLGLTFCRLAVEAHGGQIDVESIVGTGSTFSFTIPLVAAA